MASEDTFNAAAVTPSNALKTAYDAAVRLFEWVDIPAFDFGNDHDGYSALLLIYQEQYAQETSLRQSVDRYAEDLRAERRTLQKENQALKTEVDALKSQISKSSQQMEDHPKSEVSTLRFQLSQANELIKELEGRVIDRDSKVTTLESKITEFELFEPLVQLGLATRLRCLEKSRVKLEGCARNKLDYSVIEKGNAAAHHGNGDADAALLHSGMLPRNSDTKYSRIFAKMYQSDVSVWPSLPQKMKDALNCVATLNVLEAFGRLPNAAACGPITDHVDVIRAKYDRLTVDEFHADEEVSRRLVFAKSLTEQILKTERQSKPGLGGRSPRSSEY